MEYKSKKMSEEELGKFLPWRAKALLKISSRRATEGFSSMKECQDHIYNGRQIRWLEQYRVMLKLQ